MEILKRFLLFHKKERLLLLATMYKILRNRKIILCAAVPSFLVDEINFEKYKEARGLYIEDPWERVKAIFTKDDYGSWHPEFSYAVNSAQAGGVVGCLFGGIIGTKQKTDNFIRTNDANIYSSTKEAYKALSRTSLLGFLGGGLRWGPPFALFFGTYSLVSSCIELYRNKVGIIDKVIAGIIIGAFHRFMFGYKGMIAGGVVGGFFGTLYGLYFWGISKLTKGDELQLKYAQFAYSRTKEIERNQLKGSFSAEAEKELRKLTTGLYELHVNNPLYMLEDTEEQKEKNIKVIKENEDNKERK